MILLISGGRNGKGLLNEPRRWGVDSHLDSGLISDDQVHSPFLLRTVI